MTALRIAYRELNWKDGVFYYEGVPFTGVAYSLFPGGQLKMETPFRDGLLHGELHEWDEAGQLMMASTFRAGALYGWHRRFYATGQIQSEARYEWGVVVARKEWKESGELLQAWTIAPGSADYRLLLRYRNLYGTMRWMEKAADFDEETRRLLQIVVDFLVQYFDYGEEAADELLAAFLSHEPGRDNADLFHHEGAYRTAALVHYLEGLKGDPAGFTGWLQAHGHVEPPREALEYFNRHYYEQ